MPELPEAETIVRGLRPRIVGDTIRSVRVLYDDVLREPRHRFGARLRGALIQSVGRRGKNVIIDLDRNRKLLVNLGMTGRLLPLTTKTATSQSPTHPAIRFGLSSGGELVFDDTRRFGRVECLSSNDWLIRSQDMGHEPLDPLFTVNHFKKGLGASKSPIRSWLLDQRRIAGIGNIYANEALYLAKIHPKRRASTIRRTEAISLLKEIRQVLQEAIRAGGTTLRDYRTAEGEKGKYARRLCVYGRDGEDCTRSRCSGEIRRIVFGGRSAFYCANCQPTQGPAHVYRP